MTNSLSKSKISVELTIDELQFMKLMLHVLEEKSVGLCATSEQDNNDLNLTMEMITSIEEKFSRALLNLSTVPFHSTLEKL